MRRSVTVLVLLSLAGPVVAQSPVREGSEAAGQPARQDGGRVECAPESPSPGGAPNPSEPATKVPEATTANLGVKLGLELYFGLTNLTGADARNTDGIWAGAQTFYPSNVSLNWNRGESE